MTSLLSPLLSGMRLLAVGCLGLSQLLVLTAPTAAQPAPPARSAAAERLMTMFSPEIQATVNACVDRGRVDLAAGATADGAIVCGDGEPEPNVSYDSYVSTLSDVLAASALIGVRTVTASDPRVSPEAIAMFLISPQGSSTLRRVIETAVTQNQLFSANSPESVTLLSDSVLSRLASTLQDPSSLTSLLGTDDQYQQVVTQFCTAPGTSVSEAQSLVPGLSSIQLYAICLQESGLADEILQQVPG